MKKQRGLVGLALVATLLMVSLALTLMSYRSLFLQIKQVQNQVEHSKNHWLAEGAIECAYSALQVSDLEVSLLSDCEDELGAVLHVEETENGYDLIASVSGITIQRSLTFSSALPSAEQPIDIKWEKGAWRDFK